MSCIGPSYMDTTNRNIYNPKLSLFAKIQKFSHNLSTIYAALILNQKFQLFFSYLAVSTRQTDFSYITNNEQIGLKSRAKKFVVFFYLHYKMVHLRFGFTCNTGHNTALIASSNTVFSPFCVNAEHSKYLTALISFAMAKPCKHNLTINNTG